MFWIDHLSNTSFSNDLLVYINTDVDVGVFRIIVQIFIIAPLVDS